MRVASLVLFSLLILTGCGGREADLAALAQAGDHDKSCQELAGEVHSLATAARRKIDRNHGRDAADLALGALGTLLFWPAWLALDVKNADGEEANSMIDRIDYLRDVAEGKACPISDWPQIARY